MFYCIYHIYVVDACECFDAYSRFIKCFKIISYIGIRVIANGFVLKIIYYILHIQDLTLACIT